MCQHVINSKQQTQIQMQILCSEELIARGFILPLESRAEFVFRMAYVNFKFTYEGHARNVCCLLLVTPCHISESHVSSSFSSMELITLYHADSADPFGLPITVQNN